MMKVVGEKLCCFLTPHDSPSKLSNGLPDAAGKLHAVIVNLRCSRPPPPQSMTWSWANCGRRHAI